MSGLRRPHQELWNNMNGLNREDEHISEMSDSPPAARHNVRGRGGRLFTPSTLCVPVHCVVCIYLNTTLYPIYCGGIEYPRGCMYATYTFFHDWCLPPNWLVATLDRTYSRLCSLCPLCLISTCGTCELWTLIFRKACLRMVSGHDILKSGPDLMLTRAVISARVGRGFQQKGWWYQYSEQYWQYQKYHPE